MKGRGCIWDSHSDIRQREQRPKSVGAYCKWKKWLAAFTRKVGRIRPFSGRILLKTPGSYKKVWPSFEGAKIPDAILVLEVHRKPG